MACRDISPSNIVVVWDSTTERKVCEKVVLLDLHVAKSTSQGGAEAVAAVDQHVVTGKVLYMSLQLSEPRPRHTLATDLESLFYRLAPPGFLAVHTQWRPL